MRDDTTTTTRRPDSGPATAGQRAHRACGILSLLVATLVLAACGGGGGGGADGGAAPLAAGTFTKTLVLPDEPSGTTSGDWDGLFASLSSLPGSRRYQALVRAENVRGSGIAQSLALRFGAVSAGNSCPNVTIRLVHSPVSATLGNSYASNLTTGRGAVATVFGPATLTIPAGDAGDYFSIPLGGAFHYNGVDNLIVDIESDACSADTRLDAHDASPDYTALIWTTANRNSATGAPWNSLADMKLGFGGGDNGVQRPGSVSISSAPFNSFVGSKIQLLYLADEIAGSGPITGLAFPVMGGQSGAQTTAQTHTVTVRMGHASRSALTSTFADNFDSGAPVTVANAVTLHIPAGMPVGRDLWVPLPDTPFTYNGRDNLLVEIETSAAAEFTWTRTHQDLGQRRLVGSAGATSGSLDGIVNDVKLRFHGGTMDVLTPSAMTDGLFVSFPYYNTEGRIQFLHRAAELGSRGTITHIACRAHRVDGDTENGFRYTVKMSHRGAATLGANFDANLSAPVTVFSGVFDRSAVVGGDWMTLPLSTPFAYNGRDNLVVEIAGTGGAAGGFACAADNNVASSTLHAGRAVYALTEAAADGVVDDFMIDTRFTVLTIP